MQKSEIKQEKRQRRHRRIRAKVRGTVKRPRLSVYKSNTRIYGQLIDDEKQVTLAAVQSDNKKRGLEASALAGKEMAKKAKEAGITKIVFDRGGFSYIGTIKAFAEGAREGGLEF